MFSYHTRSISLQFLYLTCSSLDFLWPSSTHVFATLVYSDFDDRGKDRTTYFWQDMETAIAITEPTSLNVFTQFSFDIWLDVLRNLFLSSWLSSKHQTFIKKRCLENGVIGNEMSLKLSAWHAQFFLHVSLPVKPLVQGCDKSVY